MLAVTGAEDGVDAFKRDHKSVEASASFLPRGLAFFGPQPLSFQRLLPCDQDESYRQYLWGCASDAANVHLLPGRPRLAGRSSIQFLFSTDNAPLAWLKSAAEQHPTLRLGLKYAIAEDAQAYEVEYIQGRRTHMSQVSYAVWAWENKVDSSTYFHELKQLLRFPDGRVPKKRKLKLGDIEARLVAEGTYERAVGLLSGSIFSISGWDGPSRRSQKLFHGVVLPQFVAWLHSPNAQLAL